MLRVRTIFTGVAGAPYYNALHFDGDTPMPVQDLIDAVGQFWSDCLVNSDAALDAQVQADVYDVDPATGIIQGVEVGSSVTWSGSGGAPLKPPTTQGLINLRTGVYVDGREVRGKVFIPSLTTDAGTDVPAAPWVGGINSNVTALIAATAGLQEWSVWSPTKGVVHPVVAGPVWNQFAVQRSRRD